MNHTLQNYRVHIRMIRETSAEMPAYEIRNPSQATALMDELRCMDREKFVSILLNSKNFVVGVHEISCGTLNASLVHPREVFKAAILANAASVILCHNHPSGDPTPSQEDVRVTMQLVKAGGILDIPIADHIVIGDPAYFSMKEQSLL